MLSHQIHLVGTIRSNRRGLPVSVTSAKLKSGEVVAAGNGHGIVVLKWKDKRDVLMLSTKHTGEMINTGKSNRRQEVIHKPAAVLDYNKHKQGINLSDHMSSYHQTLRKSVRWFHKVALHLLLGVAVVNALNLYNARQKSAGKKLMKTATFREQIRETLLSSNEEGNAKQVNEVCTPRVDRKKLAKGHYLQKTVDKQSGKRADRSKRRYCTECYESICKKFGRAAARRKAKRVTTTCPACPGNPSFCLMCFAKFHMPKNASDRVDETDTATSASATPQSSRLDADRSPT